MISETGRRTLDREGSVGVVSRDGWGMYISPEKVPPVGGFKGRAGLEVESSVRERTRAANLLDTHELGVKHERSVRRDGGRQAGGPVREVRSARQPRPLTHRHLRERLVERYKIYQS